MGVKLIKDLVHNYISIDDDIQKIVDTSSFQRLRRIRQLSCNYIFPSTNHTRYEHSLGVMQLACIFFDKLRQDMIKLKLTESEIDNLKNHLKMASILHDIGHPPFSHLGEKFLDEKEIFNAIKEEFSNKISVEETFLDENGKIVGKEHELLSCYVILRNFSNILNEIDKNIDISFICRCIIGNEYRQDIDWSKNICINILNSDSIDVDKLDYLMRDNHMAGEIAPKMDITRLLNCIFISDDKKIKFVAKAIPAVQSIIDSRDSLYLWVYHHHISIYTDYVTCRIINRCIELYNENKNSFEGINRQHFFSPRAISDNLITDDDIYSHLRKIYINRKSEFIDDFNKIAIEQIFERKFLKSLWKTIYEYKDFENMLLKEGYINSYDDISEIIENKNEIESITKNISKKLNIHEAEIFIITKHNKFYNATVETPTYIYLNGEDRKLSELLPQKFYTKFREMLFFVFAPSEKIDDVKNELIEEIKKRIKRID